MLSFATLPIVVPQLAIVLKVLFMPSECGQEHTLQIRALDPRGQQFYHPFGVTLVPALNPLEPDRPVPFELVYNLREVVIGDVGKYVFQIELDRLQISSIEVQVAAGQVSPTPSAKIVETLADALLEGYQSFTHGDLDQATKTFTRLADKFPHSPDAHNNLGFTSLAAGRVDEALSSFQHAMQEGFRYPEFLQANIACCLYLKGQYEQAQKMFESLMRMRMSSPQAVLFALGRSSAKALVLQSPGDYLALMALNAARSALARGAKEAKLLAGMAQAGRITFGGGNGDQAFNELLKELLTDLQLKKQ